MKKNNHAESKSQVKKLKMIALGLSAVLSDFQYLYSLSGWIPVLFAISVRLLT
jgi:hypothetical protein